MLEFFCRFEESEITLEDAGLCDVFPTVETSDTADTEVDGPEIEEELGIFQVLERLEEVTKMLTCR